MAKITNYEKETVVNFNDAEDMAEVYTHNTALKRKLDKLCKTHPDIYKLKKENKEWESKTYIFHKKYISFRTPRFMTEEQKEKSSERFTKMWEDKRSI